MPTFPFIVTRYPDELLYSYILRTSIANGFSDLRQFKNAYFPINKKSKYKKQYTFSYDIRYDLYDFLKKLEQDNTKSLPFYHETSMFQGMVPLMSKSIASHHIGLISKYKNNTSLLTSLNNMVSDLRYCPECAKENEIYFQRAHHMPGVTVCNKHNCALLSYSNSEPLPIYSKSFEYATFCKEFLDANLDIHSDILINALRTRYNELNIKSNLKQQMSEYMNLTDYSPIDFMKTTYTSTPYINPNTCLVLLLFLFKDINTLKEYIVKDDNFKTDFLNKINNKYYLISDYRNTIVELECLSCTTKFLSTPYRILSGWGCPCCDSKLDDNTLLHHLITTVSKGEYSLCSSYKNMNTAVNIKHLKCEKNLNIAPRKFLDDNVRCSCEYTISKEQIRNEVESSGEYKLIKYERTDKPLIIKHLLCGQTFTFTRDKFNKKPKCKICNPSIRTEDIFKQEIYARVGDEYKLVGPYKDKDTQVDILHTKCNTIQSYYPRNFLDGLRCKKCREDLKPSDFTRIVSEISNGKYICIGMKTDNLAIIKNTSTNEIVYLSQNKTLQELLRFIPSSILPLENRNKDVVFSSHKKDILYRYIKENYNENVLIFLEDITINDISYPTLKKCFQTLVKNEQLKLIYPGIYSYPNVEFSDKEIINARYINRKNNVFGYLAGFSLAYELGLNSKKPDKIEIVTNKEASTHGRSMTFLGKSIKLHGARINITNENHIILAVLTFLMSYKQRKYTDSDNVNTVIYKLLVENNIKLSDFEPYYEYYASWSRKIIENVYKEGENA